MTNKTITVTLTADEQLLLANDLLDADAWVQTAVTGKINNCWKRFQQEWTNRLMDDVTFMGSIPGNRADFIALVIARPDYKDRAARDAAQAAKQAV